MSVSQSQTPEGETVLKNEFHVSFNGISFSADDTNPAVLSMADGTEHNLTLLSWEQTSPLAYSFSFTEDTSIVFAITDTTAQASLSVSAHLPADAKTLSVMYKPASGFSVTDQSATKQTVSSKNISYKMNAPAIDDHRLKLTKANAVAMYTYYDERAVFAFENVPFDENAAREYEEAIALVRERIITVAEASMRDTSQITESVLSAYIAEMASREQFEQAIATVPESFKRGTKRTYITSPYFDTLVQMNPSLIMANENMMSMVTNAVTQKTLDIFAVTNIADFMMRESANQNVKLLAALPSTLAEFTPTLTQANGIVSTYLRFAKAGSQLADSLSPVVGLCLDYISQSCKLNGNMIVLTEKENDISFLLAVEIGKTLESYGEYTGANEYINGGKIIVATAFDQNSKSSLDIRTLAELYPILVPDMPNYPHAQLFGRYQNETVWAWTVATDITYTENASGEEATITIDFPQGSSHYIIINGIRPFSEINIYGVPFRSDPRFETYNSSGYVYNERTHTLFLKSRQKAQKETVRLVFR